MNTEQIISYITSYLTIFMAVPAALVCYIPMKNQLRRPRKWIIIHCLILLIVGVIGIIYVGNHFERLNGTLVLVPFLGLFFSYYALSVRAHVTQSAAIFFMVCSLAAIPSFAAFLVDSIVHPAGNAKDASAIFNLIQGGGFVLLCIPAGLILHKWGIYLVDNLRNWRVWGLIGLISAMIFAVLSIMAPEGYEIFEMAGVRRTYLAVFIAISLIFLLTAAFFMIVSFTIIRTEELQERDTIYRMQNRQYQQLQDQVERIRILRHDFRHSLGLIQKLAEKDDMKGIQDYLSKIEENIPQQVINYYCDNELINTILNFYGEKAQAAGARVKFLVDIPEFTEDQTFDLVSVLGNLLDNALQGCETVPEHERGIQMRMATINGENLYILVSNTFSGKIRRDGDDYLSTKRKRSVRGVGIRSVKMIAKKYGGEAKFYHQGKIFNADITMRVEK